MGGGLLQLVAIGAQDKKLIGNPQTNFFKSVYTHYYNFSMESVRQYFDGDVDFNKTCSVNIKRVGDLVSKCYLECTIDNLCYGCPANLNCGVNNIGLESSQSCDDASETLCCCSSNKSETLSCSSDAKLKNIARFTANIATAIIDKVEFKIGGQIIDSHTGTWMETWNELSNGNNGLTFPYIGDVDTNICADTNICTDCCCCLYKDCTQSSSNHDCTSNAVDCNTECRYNPVVCSGCSKEGDILIQEAQSNFIYLSAGVGGGIVQAFDSTQFCKIAGKRFWSLRTPFYVPFNFWFNREIGSALPLIALQYHEATFKIKFQDYKYIGNNQGFSSSKTPKLNACIWINYIFLDTDLRRKFAQEKHEYIIDQVQYNEFSGGNNTLELNFNHPIKFLTWIGSPYKIPFNNQGFEFASIGPSTPTSFLKKYCDKPCSYNDVQNYIEKMRNVYGITIELKLNGHSRFEARNARYFTKKTKNESDGEIYGNVYLLLSKDEGLPTTNLQNSTNDAYGIGYYPFCLPGYALGLTPAGTCNFSRLDNAKLIFKDEKHDFLLGPTIVYAMNYNFLRIESGMGGLLYNN